MDTVIRYFQFIGFFATQITNILLLLLLVGRAKAFGRYKFLMMLFSIYAMIYSFIEVITLPIVCIFGPSLIVYSDGILKYQKWIGQPMTILFCASFGLCIAQLTLQFVYRYIAVCKSDKLYIFDGYKLIIPLIPCASVFILWYLAVYSTLQITIEKQVHFKDYLMENYDEDSFKVSFIAVIYKEKRFNNVTHWNWDQFSSVMVCCGIMAICFNTIIFCAFKTFQQMRNSSPYLSRKTKELNKQLFMTLGLQTLLPLFTMYMPVGLLLILPIFEIDVGKIANQSCAYVALYTALDPLIAIFMIKQFRETVLCRRKSKMTATVGSTTGT